MTYAEFKIEYTSLFNAMKNHSPDQGGAGYFVEKIANLADEYPEFVEMIDNEDSGKEGGKHEK